jgi:hypothetical protein
MTISFQRGDAKNLQALNKAVQTYNEGLGQQINSKVFFFLGDYCLEHARDKMLYTSMSSVRPYKPITWAFHLG